MLQPHLFHFLLRPAVSAEKRGLPDKDVSFEASSETSTVGCSFFLNPKNAAPAIATGISTQQATGINANKNPKTPHNFWLKSVDSTSRFYVVPAMIQPK